MSVLPSWRRLQPQFLVIWPATAILFVVSPFLATGSVSASSLLSVLSFASILAIAAIGQTLVIQQGGLDLTVPGVISLAAVFVTKFPAGDNALLFQWALVAIGSGMISGLICGIAITRFQVTPLVATLAVNALLYGSVLYITKGTSTHEVPSLLGDFAVGRAYGIPNLAFVALVAIVLVEVGIRSTKYGRRFVAIGANNRAARAAGMPVVTYKIATYVFAGAIYAVAGSPARRLSRHSEPARRKHLSPAHHHRRGARRNVAPRRGRQRGRHRGRRDLPDPARAGDDRHGRAHLDPVHHPGGDHRARHGRSASFRGDLSSPAPASSRTSRLSSETGGRAN